MTGERRLNRDLRSLQVADLADHDDVGIVAQHRAQDLSEREADLRLDLHLVDAVELVLDRVLDREHLAVRRVQLDQRGVERGGLAAAGRAGDQDDAVRAGERLVIGVERIAGEAKRREVERDAGPIQDAQDHRLAVHGGHRGDAQVDVLAAHRELDAAILGQAALGDVEARHDLDARDDRGAQLQGRRFDLAQHAVDAIAYAQVLFERLDVDVRGPRLDRPRDQPVDDPHHRRLARQIAQPLDVILGAEFALIVDLLNGLPGRPAAPEQALERGLDVRRHADPGQHRLAREQLHRADRVAIKRIRHRHRQAFCGIGERHDARLFEEIRADPITGQRQIRIVGLAGQRQIEQLRQRLGHLPLRYQAELGQEHVQAIMARLARPLGAAEAGPIEPPALDQQLLERLVDRGRILRHAGQLLRRHGSRHCISR